MKYAIVALLILVILGIVGYGIFETYVNYLHISRMREPISPGDHGFILGFCVGIGLRNFILFAFLAGFVTAIMKLTGIEIELTEVEEPISN